MNRGDHITAMYFIIALIMFGHNATARDRAAERQYTECMAVFENPVKCNDMESSALGAVFAGLFWPAYVSWMTWESVQ